MIGSGYTYSGHPVGAAAAVACVEETMRLRPWENAGPRGTQIFKGLKQLMDKHEVVGDVRGGHGLMSALELVEDRQTKTPISADRIGRVFQAAYEAGAIVRVSGHNIFMSPPLILTSEDVDGILAALDHGLAAA